jgi:hypothetical protein
VIGVRQKHVRCHDRLRFDEGSFAFRSSFDFCSFRQARQGSERCKDMGSMRPKIFVVVHSTDEGAELS